MSSVKIASAKPTDLTLALVQTLVDCPTQLCLNTWIRTNCKEIWDQCVFSSEYEPRFGRLFGLEFTILIIHQWKSFFHHMEDVHI